jgi:putative flavoprotein involved in K+ transport
MSASQIQPPTQEESFGTIVIGGGQAGLAAGYFLARARTNFIILDENPRTGASWRSRWDSLRLFTPSQFDGLPGFPFPQAPDTFPTKEDVAGYLEQYADRFHLPVRHGVKVDRLSRSGAAYRLSAGSSLFHARNVVVASGPYQIPYLPGFAAELDPAIQQVHSHAYRNPGQIPAKEILVVGAGNSGSEIALELGQAGKRVWLAGRDVGELPFTRPVARAFGGRPAWWLMSRLLNVATPVGRRARAGALHHGIALGRPLRKELEAARIERTGRVSGLRSGQPQLEDGRLLNPGCVIWATGFRPDYRWIQLPVSGDDGYPLHRRGVVPAAPGLYFLGLTFQSAFKSSLLGGVGADAVYIAAQIARRETMSTASPEGERQEEMLLIQGGSSGGES